MEKIALFDIQTLADYYEVNIDMSFGKDRKVTVSNGTEIESFYSSFDNITHDNIVRIARGMRIKTIERREETKTHLANLSKEDVDKIPDNLFSKETYSLNDKYEELDDDELFLANAPLKYQVLSVLSGCMDADHVVNFSLNSEFFIRFTNEEPDLEMEDIVMGIRTLANEGYLDKN